MEIPGFFVQLTRKFDVVNIRCYVSLQKRGNTVTQFRSLIITQESPIDLQCKAEEIGGYLHHQERHLN